MPWRKLHACSELAQRSRPSSDRMDGIVIKSEVGSSFSFCVHNQKAAFCRLPEV